MHGMRRCILRSLNYSDTPNGLRELSEEFPEVSLSQVSFHVLVLSDCGSVAIADVEPAATELSQLFISTVAANPQIVSALQATETLDDPLGLP